MEARFLRTPVVGAPAVFERSRVVSPISIFMGLGLGGSLAAAGAAIQIGSGILLMAACTTLVLFCLGLFQLLRRRSTPLGIAIEGGGKIRWMTLQRSMFFLTSTEELSQPSLVFSRIAAGPLGVRGLWALVVGDGAAHALLFVGNENEARGFAGALVSRVPSIQVGNRVYTGAIRPGMIYSRLAVKSGS